VLCIRAAPPVSATARTKDCGGPWRYEELLATIKEPKHPEYERMMDWLGGEFDPEEFELEGVKGRLG
jgi:hypothetical protein